MKINFKRPVFVILTAIILIAIQASPAYDLIRFIAVAKPDMLLVFIAFIGFRYGMFEGLIYGFAIGLAQDSVSGGTLGLNAIIFLNLGLVSGFFSNKIYSKRLTVGIILTMIAACLKSLSIFLITVIYLDLESAIIVFKSEFLASLPLTVLLASPLFIIFDKLAPLIYENGKAEVNDMLGKDVNE